MSLWSLLANYAHNHSHTHTQSHAQVLKFYLRPISAILYAQQTLRSKRLMQSSFYADIEQFT